MADPIELASKRFVRRRDVLDAGIDGGETVLLHPERGQYFGLKGAVQRIWELLESPTTIDEICAVLVEEFDVTPRTCHDETAELISQLVSEQLVEVVPH
jgi:hypothetical protein